jgi:DNA polymerase I-like protein with 3'-5' exonuclease and polymerase domains
LPRLKRYSWDRYAAWGLDNIRADAPTVVAVDCETTGLGFHNLAFAATASWRTQTGVLRSCYFDLEADGREARISALRQALASVPMWVFHNAKFDLGHLEYISALPPLEGHTVEDTQPLASLLDENRRMALKSLAVTELGIEDVVEVVVKSGPNKGAVRRVPREKYHLDKARRKLKLTKDDGYHLLPKEVILPYAEADTELTLLLWEKLRPQLPPDLEPVYAEEMEVIHVLRKMESNGVGIDVEYLTQAVDEYGAKVMVGELRLRELTGRDDFNANSVPQLREAFKAAGVTMDSTDKTAMRDLLADPSTPQAARELAEAVRDFRDAEKVFGTYLRPLLTEQRDGLAHPWINGTGPRTGRTSSSRAYN